MSIDIRVQPLNTAFKHWQNLAVGTLLMAFSAYLTYSARNIVTDATTQLQGWAMLIIAGYAFVAALFLGLSAISEHSPLPQVLPSSQMLSQGLSFVIGGAFLLIATVVAIAAAFKQPRELKNTAQTN